MTYQEFQKTIIKTNWYDKYYYYLISFAAIGGSIFLFHDIATNSGKYKNNHSQTFAYCAFSLLFLLGCYSLYLVANRYKILTVENSLSIDNKKEIIGGLFHKLGLTFNETQDTFYTFKYQRKWWTSAYDIYINLDDQKFYICVLGCTNSYPSSGFIDFGGTERLRKKIISIVKYLNK